jgi:hypothetical protein
MKMQTGCEEDGTNQISYERYWGAGAGEDAVRAREERESRMMEMDPELTVLDLELQKQKCEGNYATGNHSG